MNIETLRRRSEFKRVRGGPRWAGPLFVVEGRQRDPGGQDREAPPLGPRFGFTITRKIGNAVVRNRIRRRLKEALRTLGPSQMRSDYDYVVVASRAAHDYPFAGLQDALRDAFARLHRQADGGRGRVEKEKRHVTGRRDGAWPGVRADSESDGSPGSGSALGGSSGSDDPQSDSGRRR